MCDEGRCLPLRYLGEDEFDSLARELLEQLDPTSKEYGPTGVSLEHYYDGSRNNILVKKHSFLSLYPRGSRIPEQVLDVD